MSSIAQILLPSTHLRLHTGLVPIAKALEKKKIIGFYFSAHWCGPCRAFTPHLSRFYNALKERSETSDDFEIIFVSSDNDSYKFEEYFHTMPWTAIQFSDYDTVEALNDRFGIKGIPALVLMNGDGSFVKTNGRELVSSQPRSFPWGIPYPPRLLEEKTALEAVIPDISVAACRE